MKIGILDIILLIIIFQLLLFSFFLIVRKKNNISNYLLALQLFSQAAGIFNTFCYIQLDFFINLNPHLYLIGFPFSFLWGPTFYLYIKSVAFSDFRFKLSHLLHFIPFAALVLYLSIDFYPLGWEAKKAVLISQQYITYSYGAYLDWFIRIQVFCYIILSIKVFKTFKEKLKENYSSLNKTNYVWVRFLITGFTTAYFITLIFLIRSTLFKVDWQLSAIAIIGTYFIFFNFIFFKAWYQPELFKGIEESVKYKSSRLGKEEAQIWINKLDQYLFSEKPFLKADLTLMQLAESISISPRILSQLINEYYKQNFQDYINTLRIEESKKLLTNCSSKKTILEILFEAGFNSKSAFNIAFKKATGMTPTEYRKQACKDSD